VETAQKYPDIIVGYKTIHYKTTGPLDEAHPPWAAIDAIEEAGRLADLPCMFHSEPRPASDGYPARSFRELILEKMRPGDIHTHCYGFAYPTMLGDTPPDKINPDIFKAQQRGVIFDVGHGSGSFTFRHAVPEIEQGFFADTISTDIYGGNPGNSCGPVFSMNNVMSKFLNIGMSLEDVIRRTTVNPARIIKRPELGTLGAGSIADVAVLELLEGDYGFYDCQGGRITGDKKIQNVMTLFGGRVVYDINGFNRTYWSDIPKDDRYWENSNDQTW
jgi:dihydroorotase